MEDFSPQQYFLRRLHRNLTLYLNNQLSTPGPCHRFQGVLCISGRMPLCPGPGYESASKKAGEQEVEGKYGSLDVQTASSQLKVSLISVQLAERVRSFAEVLEIYNGFRVSPSKPPVST